MTASGPADHGKVHPQRALRPSRARAGRGFHAARQARDAVHHADLNTGKKLVLIDTGTGGQIAPTAG